MTLESCFLAEFPIVSFYWPPHSLANVEGNGMMSSYSNQCAPILIIKWSSAYRSRYGRESARMRRANTFSNSWLQQSKQRLCYILLWKQAKCFLPVNMAEVQLAYPRGSRPIIVAGKEKRRRRRRSFPPYQDKHSLIFAIDYQCNRVPGESSRIADLRFFQSSETHSNPDYHRLLSR